MEPRALRQRAWQMNGGEAKRDCVKLYELKWLLAERDQMPSSINGRQPSATRTRTPDDEPCGRINGRHPSVDGAQEHQAHGPFIRSSRPIGSRISGISVGFTVGAVVNSNAGITGTNRLFDRLKIV